MNRDELINIFGNASIGTAVNVNNVGNFYTTAVVSQVKFDWLFGLAHHKQHNYLYKVLLFFWVFFVTLETLHYTLHYPLALQKFQIN